MMLQKQKQEKEKEKNPNWLQILDHPYNLLIIGGSGSGEPIHYLFR